MADDKKWISGDWMQTYTGVEFYPLNPRPEDIRFTDISSALSKQCRYGGHCTKFYSVAEHCIHVASMASDELKLTALMHDAAEAYLTDVVRPIKKHLGGYLEIEARLERVLADKYGLVYPYPAEIKRLDNSILTDERQQNMAPPPKAWDVYETVDPLGVTLQFWTPAEACYRYTTAFYAYGGAE
jgi:hypothetical protein